MFLKPKKTKFKKYFKKKLKKYKHNTNFFLKHGTIGLKSTNSGMISARQIESARQAIMRKIKRKGKLWIKIFPHLPITKKPLESRMGKGKGSVSHWVAKVSGGTLLFELYCSSKKKSLDALNTGKAKLPVKTKIIFY